MSLVSRVSDLAARVAQEIKSIRDQMVTTDTSQTVTGAKTFAGSAHFDGVPTVSPDINYANSVLAFDSSGLQQAYTASSYGDVLTLTGVGIGWGPATGGGLQGRVSNAILTTSMLASNGSEVGTAEVEPGFRVLRVETDYPARVRLYPSIEHRDADASRSIAFSPSGNHGLLLETASLLVVDMAPAVGCYSLSGSTIAWSVANLDSVARAITVTLTYVRNE